MERMKRIMSWFFLAFYSFCVAASSAIAVSQTNLNLTTDQSALLSLKASVTSDPHNMILTNWSATTSVCSWVGVTCGVRHLGVQVLNLTNFGLTGTIPPQLGNLSFLVELDFTNNSFRGPLPRQLARLHRLKSLRFKFNNIMGAIPSWFGSLSKLETLDFHGNQFSGSIPAAIFNLSALQVIDLGSNQLSGGIPGEIGNLTKLKEIYLQNNNFLEIPNEIGTLKHLEILYLHSNALKGPLHAVFNVSSLVTLALYRNSFEGRLPDNICQHLPRIQRLSLYSNQFDGAVPLNLGQCKELQSLQLFQNNLTGSIPTSIGNATQLRLVGFGDNVLTGTIPHEIGYLNLEVLNLEVNNLHGFIPTTIFNMSRLRSLSLGVNELTGSLPPNIGVGLPNLENFYLPDIQLTGVFPYSITNASKLINFELTRNSFHGSIPSKLCALVNLQLLNLEGNNLTIDTSTPEANVFSCLANLRNLNELYFAYNPLNITIPLFVGNLTSSLESVYLSNCNLTGNIPNGIGNMSSLTALDLGYNQLSGPVPKTIERLQNLQAVALDNNRLEGYIPAELCQLKNLAELYLTGNQFYGSIPACFGDLTPALRRLSLRSNLLASTIPSTLWRLEYILLLDLSSNFLVGPLSEGVNNLKAVIQMDLSNNRLSGNIPSRIEGLQNLATLSLANNMFSGTIPSSFGKLLSMKYLDLSTNNLSGEIPKSLEALSHLEYLNFSFNRLQGEIPTGGPFRNITAQSFISSGQLCGAPRFHVPLCSTFKAHFKASKSMLKYIIPGILAAIFIVTSIWILIKGRKNNVEVAKETTLATQLLWRRVSYHELVRATDGFNESNLLGSGGFGSVYKGTLSDGMDVAVKVFNSQLEEAFKSFDTECEMLSNLRHRNLVKVISCCSQIDFKALVLNYMPNGSLEKWLYAQDFSLNILQRMSIMIDVASALEYLHHGYEVPIVHCDLKPSNILLDDGMSAHVADFGISKLLADSDSMTQTITLATVGYMAPEYGMEGIVTRRGDVYSFGIVLMETFTRKKPTDEMFVGELSLKQWVANSPLLDVVDANLLGTEEDRDRDHERNKECVSSVMELSLACLAESPEDRINMQEILATLKKIKDKFFKGAAAAAGRGVVSNRPPV